MKKKDGKRSGQHQAQHEVAKHKKLRPLGFRRVASSTIQLDAGQRCGTRRGDCELDLRKNGAETYRATSLHRGRIASPDLPSLAGAERHAAADSGRAFSRAAAAQAFAATA